MNRKYMVSFGYICDGGLTRGTARPKVMRFDDLELALAMIDPFRHAEWMESVAALRRRGDSATITMTSDSDTYGTVGRVIKVDRV